MEQELNQLFWDNRYKNNQTGWDLGCVSPPLKLFIDQIEDLSLRILIPGAGNAYEAEYLAEKGFKNVTVIDIAPSLVEQLKEKFKNKAGINIIQGDFFEHQGEYDVILEQTFFCALHPSLRDAYGMQMKSLLAENGSLVGVLFNRSFDGGPPFGGSQEEYEQRFKKCFNDVKFEPCKTSHPARLGNEVWMEVKV